MDETGRVSLTPPFGVKVAGRGTGYVITWNLCRRVETEEAGQGLGRTLLDQEMPAVQRLSGDVVRPGAPDRECVVPGREGSPPAPQDLRGTGDRAARGAVLVVQPAVTGRAGAVVLADGP